jgi:hypothetical protein
MMVHAYMFLQVAVFYKVQTLHGLLQSMESCLLHAPSGGNNCRTFGGKIFLEQGAFHWPEFWIQLNIFMDIKVALLLKLLATQITFSPTGFTSFITIEKLTSVVVNGFGRIQ